MRSLLPPLFAAGVVMLGSATAQEIDWQKIDAAFGESLPSPATCIDTAFRAPIFR